MGKTIEQMRKSVASAYNTKRWKRLVRKMPEKQVMAIYFRLNRQENARQPQHYTDIYHIPERYQGYTFTI